MSHLKPFQEHLNRWTLGYVGLAIERCGPQPVLNGAFGTVPLSVGDWLRCTSIAEIASSGLCGRGGAGYPAAGKWRTALSRKRRTATSWSMATAPIRPRGPIASCWSAIHT